MNRLLAEFEMFCYIIETRPYVIYVPALWLIFCFALAFFINSLSLEPTHLFYNIVQDKLQKQHTKLVIIGSVGYFMLTWRLYCKHRKQLF